VTEQSATAYFETPELTERLQLVAHLLRNTGLVPYVRGQTGAGKSRFARRLMDSLHDEATVVLLDGPRCADVPAAICQALGMAEGDWPAVVLDAQPAPAPALIVLVDDADGLDPQAQADLLALQAGGGRLVLLGGGNPAPLSEEWPIQFIDLPPLTEAQARDFLAFTGGVEAALLSDAALHRLHQQAGGQPGALLAGPAGESIGTVGEMPAGPPWKWLLGGAAAALVILVLWQQERINSLFSPPEPSLADAPQATAPEASAPDSQIAIPPLPLESTPAPAPSEPPAPMVTAPAQSQSSLAAEDMPAATAPDAQVVAESIAPAVPAEMPATPPVAGEPPPSSVLAAEAEPMPVQVQEAPFSIVRTPEPVPTEPLPSEPVPMVKLAPPPPAPAERVAQPVAVPESPKPAAPLKAPVVSEPAATDDLGWLRSRQPDHYTLQLLGVRERAAIEQFIRVHRLKGKYAVFTRDLNGKPWYSLVYGDYPDRDAALRGRAALPASLRRANVWPRTFASVWEQLPATTGPR